MFKEERKCGDPTVRAVEASESEPMLRLALVSTPRSGNTWTRALLASLYDLEPIPVHHPDEIDWDALPRRCVIQIHWYPIEPFVGLLEQHGVQVAVLARHPFDVLMSWLNYAYYVHQEGYCPGGGACNECSIVGTLPRSPEFLQWVQSEFGRCLLCYSPAWWHRDGILRLRYEDLVKDAESSLTRFVAELGVAPRRSIAEVVAANTIAQRKPGHDVWHFHFWQGRPGLWRELITAPEARAIASYIPEPFESLGYACDPNERLEPGQADQNWTQMQLASTREHLGLERSKHRKTIKDLNLVREELAALTRALQAEQESHAATRQALSETEMRVRGRNERAALEVARRLKRVLLRAFGNASRSAPAGRESQTGAGSDRSR